MFIRRSGHIPASEITAEAAYRERRRFLKAALAGAVAMAMGGLAARGPLAREVTPGAAASRDYGDLPRSPLSTTEHPTSYEDVTSFNNFYEFGIGKGDPARYAGSLRTHPWSVVVEGEIARAGTYALEDLLKPHPMAEYIYRLRCVEGWSMVIPWVGFPLGDLVKRMQPTSRAKYVEFTTLHDPEQMPGQRRDILPWPYVEGLRIDEAVHPLTILAVGLYGRELPNQSGAPLRLVVPWKYGFKSIKTIVRIRFTEHLPRTTWQRILPGEFGFFANVNPSVGHPRWSQQREWRIGESRKRDTLPFNGYGEEVAHLYSGMDLKKDF